MPTVHSMPGLIMSAERKSVNNQALTIVDVLKSPVPLNALAVGEMPLQEYLATVRQISEEGAKMSGFEFDVLLSIPYGIRNTKSWEALGLSGSNETEELARRFEDYTFAKTPEVRDPFFETMRIAKGIETYPYRFSRGKGIKLSRSLRKNLSHLLQNKTLMYAPDLETRDMLSRNLSQIQRAQLIYYDNVPRFNPLNLLVPGWTKLTERSIRLSIADHSLKEYAGETVASLNHLGNQYRDFYISEPGKHYRIVE